MGLSAEDIESQDFGLSRKGYDRAEVERFRAKVAKRVRKLERKLAAAEAEADAPADESAALTRHLGELLKLAGEQTQRTADEAEAAASRIVGEARAEAAAEAATAAEARRVALDAIETVRLQVAATIETELGLHDQLEAAADSIRSDQNSASEAGGSSEDPLAQVVRDAVGRANPGR